MNKPALVAFALFALLGASVYAYVRAGGRLRAGAKAALLSVRRTDGRQSGLKSGLFGYATR